MERRIRRLGIALVLLFAVLFGQLAYVQVFAADDIKNHPLLKGLTLPRLGQPGRTFIGVLTTKNLVIAGEGGVHSNASGRRVALLRAYDKRTGADVGEVEMPAKQTGSPMTYQIDGKQFIVLAVSGNDGAELLAFARP